MRFFLSVFLNFFLQFCVFYFFCISLLPLSLFLSYLLILTFVSSFLLSVYFSSSIVDVHSEKHGLSSHFQRNVFETYPINITSFMSKYIYQNSCSSADQAQGINLKKQKDINYWQFLGKHV